MRLTRRSLRPAFSLLEMVLALAIAMLLLAALYATMNQQITYSQAGRDVLAEGTMARFVLTRIANDIVSQFGPLDPRGMPDASAASSSANTSDATSMTTSGSGSSSQGAVLFNVGVQGDATNLILSLYRVQKPTAGTVSSDVRRISYWMASNGPDSQGLARKEFLQATQDDIDTAPPALPDQNKCIVAPEVSSITFEYFDGTAWQASWDGTVTETPGAPPLGPPQAIRITVTLRRAPSNRANNASNLDADLGPSYQHVVALPTANFFNQQSSP